MAEDRVAYCPDHPEHILGKAGSARFGTRKVPRWRCSIDYKTYTSPIFKDKGTYGEPNVELPEGEEETTFPSESTYEAPTAPAYEAPVYKPPRKKKKKSAKSFDDISIGSSGLNIGDISKGTSIDSMSL